MADFQTVKLPAGLCDIELYPVETIHALLGAAIRGDDGAMMRLGPLTEIVRSPPPDCSACGAPFDHPPRVVGLMIEQVPTCSSTFGFAICAGCYADGPNATIMRLGAFLAGVGITRPICDGPVLVQ